MLNVIASEQGRAILLVQLLLLILQRAKECEMSKGSQANVNPSNTAVESLPPFMPLFRIGRLSATPSALGLLGEHGIKPVTVLRRHVCGDWGEVCQEASDANHHAVVHGLRILSVYKINDHELWVITEADRSLTTLLLPEDY